MNDVKHLLQECYDTTKKYTGYEPRHTQSFRQMLGENKAFDIYKRGLLEGLSDSDRDDIDMLIESTRVGILENSMFQLNPYETLTMPILRVFYPKLISKELVNVMPIDKPEVIKGFIRAAFRRYGDPTGTYPSAFPSVDRDISRGPSVGVTSTHEITIAQAANYNVLGAINTGTAPGLTAQNSHIEKDIKITGISDGTTVHEVSIIPNVDGSLSESIEMPSGVVDVLSGHVDFLNGVLYLSTTECGAAGGIQGITFEATATLEENMINPYVQFNVEKIRLTVIDRRISTQWTINMEQDLKALYELQLQSELVNVIGEQIALDIDREIINGLIDANTSMNPASHTTRFNLHPPDTYTWGRKMWIENVIPRLNTLAAQIYNSCLMGAANTLACNPLDAAVFESLNSFEYTGNSVDGGDVGYKSATVSGGKWKVLVSSIVPQGTTIAKYRSPELTRAAFVYAPYVPVLLIPYPLGTNPSLTIMSRYATKIIRHEALGSLVIVDDYATRNTDV